jgi:cardiolipin synthase
MTPAPPKLRPLLAGLTWPNRITLLRFVLVIPYVMALLQMSEHGDRARYVALGLFVFMALSDAADGILARVLNERSYLGAILDPLADKVLIICSTILLAIPSITPEPVRLPSWVVVAVVAKDLWVLLGCEVMFLVNGTLKMGPTPSGKLSTVIQALMVGFALIAPEMNTLRDGLGQTIVLVASAAVTALCGLAIMSYTRMGLGQLVEAQLEKTTEETH